MRWPGQIPAGQVCNELAATIDILPTLVTLAMYPILVYMYARLARREEAEMLEQFGDEYRRYAERVPAFFPRLAQGRAA